MTALVPTPFRPTENWKTSSLYLAPVLMMDTHSTTLPSGMPRPKSRTATLEPSMFTSIRSPAAHDELVDRVVHHFLEEDVDAVVRVRAGAEPSDVHPRSEPYVLQGREGLYLGFIVVVTGCHGCECSKMRDFRQQEASGGGTDGRAGNSMGHGRDRAAGRQALRDNRHHPGPGSLGLAASGRAGNPPGFLAFPPRPGVKYTGEEGRGSDI